jgi:hypothetical protein
VRRDVPIGGWQMREKRVQGSVAFRLQPHLVRKNIEQLRGGPESALRSQETIGWMGTETRRSDKLVCRLVGAHWERCGWDQGGNDARRDPIARVFQEGPLEQGPPNRAEAPAKAEKCLGKPGLASAEGV